MVTSAAKGHIFSWQGIDRQGRSTKGEIESISLAMAKAQLRQQGIKPKTVRKKSKPLFNRSRKISPQDISIFTRQLATMMKAGVPLVQSFDIVAEGLDNPSMKEVVTDIKNEVSSGTSLALALAKYPRHFDELFVNLVGSGETSGTLETMLDRVAIYKENPSNSSPRSRRL